jgi:hypothetical protein
MFIWIQRKLKHKTELNGLQMTGWQALTHPEMQEIRTLVLPCGFPFEIVI